MNEKTVSKNEGMTLYFIRHGESHTNLARKNGKLILFISDNHY
jgi:broad specificity phosphatase PhoE